MTATPILTNFMPKEIKHLPVVKVEWEGEERLNAYLYHNKKDYRAALAHVATRIKNERPGANFHIFLNSVRMIVDILAVNKLKPELVRIVCSDKKWNWARIDTLNDTPKQKEEKEKEQELIDDIQAKYTITTVADEVRRFNFYTSTAFEGCDIFDENGVNIIVSSPYLPYTLLDIRTTVRQVCGRVRNSKYKNEVHYIYMTQEPKEIFNIQEEADEQVRCFRRDESLYLDLNNLKKENRKKLKILLEDKLPYYIIVGDNMNKFVSI